MERATIYEFAGAGPAFLALAAALHQRCIEDPVLEHPFSHGLRPDHVERLASYLGEVFGGPPVFSQTAGDHSYLLSIHAGQGMDDDLGDRFLVCFVQAADDAGLPDDAEFREALRAYMRWATTEVMSYNTSAAVVPPGRTVPHWSWDGLQPTP